MIGGEEVLRGATFGTREPSLVVVGRFLTGFTLDNAGARGR